MKNRRSLTIGWIYPELMNIYGDRGNIIVLKKRCEWRGISANIKYLTLGFAPSDIKKCDIIMMGGAQDIQQQIVEKDILSKKRLLAEVIESGISGLFVCGAYQTLGKYYKDADGNIIKGLEIFDHYTVSPGEGAKRLIGNLAAELNLKTPSKIRIIVGFENHGGRTYLGKKAKPLAYVLNGNGNNGEDKTEGAVYKNSIGTYMHGAILPKNPHLADFLILNALKKKYQVNKLLELDDTEEMRAHDLIAKRMGVEI